MNKVMLITGSGRGIGAATARLAAEQDYFVCINYRQDQQSAEQLVDTIRSQGGQALAIAADVSQDSEVQRLFAAVDTQGTLCALVNNVGIVAPSARVDELSAERIQHLLNTNVLSYFLCAREAVRRMSQAYGGQGGCIVNVSSAAARLGSPGEYVDYAASKGAIDSLTTGLALEVANEGIRVNAVRPGFIHTDIHASSGDPERVLHRQHLLPMRRGGYPEEVAEAIIWLLSAQASYVTGSFIDVAGGR
ncbi:SDR family oxidoreductase [Neisseriaceae bacterium TC5R-5]|nr:SDR family oxidoreductase [Neisseriaceae bacterium TC5R-5]